MISSVANLVHELPHELPNDLRLYIEFYYEDIMDYIKKHKKILDLESNLINIYNEILKNEYQKYTILGQNIWNQYSNNDWKQIWNNTFFSYCWPENNNILYMLLDYSARTNDHIYRWTNQKHLKNPNCKLCDEKEDIMHLYISCKRNKEFGNTSKNSKNTIIN